MVAPQTREGWSSEQRTCRRLSPGQKAEVVLAGLRGGRSVRDACREYQIAETLSDQWRVRLPEGGKAAVGQPRARRPRSRPSWTRLTRRVGQLERALGRKTYEPGGGGGILAGRE
jgi:transposase-like protein